MPRESYMRQALALARDVHGAIGPNPRVGAVLVAPDGTVVGRGAHQGAGTAHAEAVALADAGPAARGATAYVTLEPCNHYGRTPPCALALIDAGVTAVHYAIPDPTTSAGGGQTCREAGLDVTQGLLADEARAFLTPWLFAVTHDRPFVTCKVASTLDGYIAAQDGSSRWITGPQARSWVQEELRAQVDAVAVGSGTYRADDPQLTVRDLPVVRQPLRYVLGDADVAAGFTAIPGHDVTAALQQMYGEGVRHLLLEGGATVAAAFIRADMVDDLVWFTAPKMLGAGTRAIGELGISAIDSAIAWQVNDVQSVGDDVMIRSSRRR
ncbi:MAG TPA: bifunctional diaminohydroxyphosphoribosylaminopyrimidine deaminase/5-amino-6-(5-phosphoribosylamino)uracil reductase RibD [Actinomycetota bacterium]|nr:bifunctional diaminohydroxyphosphoribosylaminopyrimidine deaminase/5-amino-6-(5-phosphoribosylamino)uracil reductase RibD [Actinomycetota bacterium]